MTREELEVFLSKNPTIQEAKALARRLSLKVKKRMKKNEVLKLLQDFAKSLVSEKKEEEVRHTREARENELPQSYGSDRLVLFPVNPNLVYVYWDLSSETLSKLSGQKEVVLRLYDVTYVVFDGTNAHRIFEAGVHLAMTRNYYFHVPMANADYLAELGFKVEGKFVPVLRSNVARTPSNAPSASVRQRWVIKAKRVVKIGEPPLKPIERIRGSSQLESGR
ncbi:MAG: Uncharacterized protein XD58_0243 [Thermotoga sp. 50_1627]|uniref:DUF4912 domain-containing protein n=1 Tax=Pseudothermotoga sp. TaxID=2033661 RepID=UPI00076DC32F|nr:MAG: Uncharacterized protein XD45_0483 [Thermotoga sp. 50_64]KUK25806.1 MAG: Uncharacterized protein XD58_0243 [Thermotoga sp. 50_1627]MBC7115491.1 DUF4912 domain-containing protein [Pseudothermotoga sp.]HBT40091.1 DUF4912 domain-containing protein [Pseudothermotoga sp.]HCO98876.1 DUF4912 domain-containing protein [Pseudothermotoga sp.]